MPTRLAALLAFVSLALLAGGCCSTRITSAGAQRSCVPVPWRRSPLLQPATMPISPAVEASWDETLHIYVIAEQPCTFLRLGTLYRRTDGRWERAAGLDGPWAPIAAADLPTEFRAPLAATRCDGGG